jgi:hypothetical protein
VSAAIIDASPHRNASTPFYFLTALSALSFLLLFTCVDLEKSRREQEAFLEKLKMELSGTSSLSESVSVARDVDVDAKD